MMDTLICRTVLRCNYSGSREKQPEEMILPPAPAAPLFSKWTGRHRARHRTDVVGSVVRLHVVKRNFDDPVKIPISFQHPPLPCGITRLFPETLAISLVLHGSACQRPRQTALRAVLR